MSLEHHDSSPRTPYMLSRNNNYARYVATKQLKLFIGLIGDQYDIKREVHNFNMRWSITDQWQINEKKTQKNGLTQNANFNEVITKVQK